MLNCLMEMRDVISPTLTQPSAVSLLLLHLNTPVRHVEGTSTQLPERYSSLYSKHILDTKRTFIVSASSSSSSFCLVSAFFYITAILAGGTKI